MTLVIAHRGSGPHGPEPENTLAAFAAAARLGADGVELDVRRSADGRLVVHHDARLPGGELVAETRYDDLPESIPTLEEALDACQGFVVNVEVKSSPSDPDFEPSQRVARETGRLVESRLRGGESRPGSLVVSSFSLEALAAFSREAPGVETAWLAGAGALGSDLVATAVAAGVSGIHPAGYLVDGPLVSSAHEAGLAVRAWTVDEPEQIALLGDLGVEAVITNEVALARETLGKCELAKKLTRREQSGS